jgi:hypothetical protein
LGIKNFFKFAKMAAKDFLGRLKSSCPCGYFPGIVAVSILLFYTELGWLASLHAYRILLGIKTTYFWRKDSVAQLPDHTVVNKVFVLRKSHSFTVNFRASYPQLL